MQRSRLAILITLAVLLAGCLGTSEAAKKRALENGDNYLKQGKLREASIIYRNIIRKDAKYGPAYARLGDVELKRGRPVEAVRAFLRAVELLPGDEEVAGKLADIYLIAYTANKTKNESLLKEVQEFSDTLLKNDPNSYHGTRLAGFIHVAKDNLILAEEFFRKADRLKPKQPELRFAITQVLVQQGKWEESEALTKQIISDSPDYQPSYDFLIMNYIRRDRRADAEAMIKRKAEHFKEQLDPMIQLAAFYLATKRQGEAEGVLNQLLSKREQYPGGRLRVGEFYMRMQNLERAEKIFADGIAKDPKRKTEYRLKLATVKASQRKMDEALKVVEEALNEDPKDNDALSMRAALLLASREPEKTQRAIADLQQLLGRTPENLVVRYNLARAYQSRNELDAARVQYEEARRLRPDFVAALLGLGQVYLAKQDYGKAIAVADDVFKYSPNNLGAQVIKINGLMNSGNLRQARTELNEYLRLQPNAPDLLFQSALIHLAERNTKEAENTLLPLRERFPQDQRVLFALAEIQLNTGRGADAVRLLQAEVKKDPRREDLHHALGNATIRTSQYDLAEAEFRQLIQMAPNNPVYYMKLGEILRRRGNQQGAIDQLKAGQKIAPLDVTANLQLALTLEANGRRPESRAFYENVLKAEPDNPIALNNLAFMLAEEGVNLDTALTYAQRARQQMPDSEDIADTVGWIYLKKQMNEQALNIFRELTAKKPENATYHFHMGLAYFQKGDKSNARKSLQTALALKPDSTNEAKIRELLAKVG